MMVPKKIKEIQKLCRESLDYLSRQPMVSYVSPIYAELDRDQVLKEIESIQDKSIKDKLILHKKLLITFFDRHINIVDDDLQQYREHSRGAFQDILNNFNDIEKEYTNYAR